MKVCAKCRTEKPLTEFYPRRAQGGIEPYCKACKKALRAEARTKPPRTPKRLFDLFTKNGPMFNGEPCWDWHGDKMVREGYGRIYYQGEMRPAHVVLFKVLGGVVPPGMVADHLCRRRICVNPAHLRIVTRTVNALENNSSPFAQNRGKNRCAEGHEYTPENTALKVGTSPRGKPTRMRICLTCYPGSWRYAIVERKPGPQARRGAKWLGPQSVLATGVDKEAR